jgi:hypothetical protein
VAALLLGNPVTARAECTYFPIPPATEAVRSAPRELVVGTVVENINHQTSDFRLRVDLVLRGSAQAGDVRRFTMLYPGWPPALNADGTVGLDDHGNPFLPCAPIRAWKGNVIVLALGALAPDGKTRYNAASWISGDVPFEADTPRTTFAEIKRLAGPPDTATLAQPDPPRPSSSADPLAPLLVGAGLGIWAAIGWRRAARGGDVRSRADRG